MMQNIFALKKVRVGGLLAVAFLLLFLWLCSAAIIESSVGALKENMGLALALMLFKAVGLCAFPLLSYILWERGYSERLFLGLLALAFIFEIPYDLCFFGKPFSFEGQNPLFGGAVCMAMLYFISRFEERRRALLFKAIMILAALAWMLMLNVRCGVVLCLVAGALSLAKSREGQYIWGAIACGICFALSPYYILTPLSFALIHFARK